MRAGKARPKDAAQTQERILTAARREFSRTGYAQTTVRAIAAAAEVSPNLITRYFGGKEGLFIAATEVRLGLDRLFQGPQDTLGQRLADAIIHRWTHMEGEDPLLALLRASGDHAAAAQTLSTFLDLESLEPLERQLRSYGMGEDEARGRALAVDAFVVGLSSRHRILRDDLHDPEAAKSWIAAAISRLVNAD